MVIILSTFEKSGILTRFYRDQELRFTVHDSSDYYQLKISVFNDDKKTDIIGETWVDLREVVVPGGGWPARVNTLEKSGLKSHTMTPDPSKRSLKELEMLQ